VLRGMRWERVGVTACGRVGVRAVGSFRQKGIEMVGKNGDWETLEGFLRVGGGFVWFLRDIAKWRRVVRVLRGWRDGERVGASVNGRVGERRESKRGCKTLHLMHRGARGEGRGARQARGAGAVNERWVKSEHGDPFLVP
jgi:hypothetical protein